MQYCLAKPRDTGLVSGLVIAAWRDAYQGFLPQSLLASLHQNPFHDQCSWNGELLYPELLPGSFRIRQVRLSVSCEW